MQKYTYLTKQRKILYFYLMLKQQNLLTNIAKSMIGVY